MIYEYYVAGVVVMGVLAIIFADWYVSDAPYLGCDTATLGVRVNSHKQIVYNNVNNKQQRS